MTDPGGGYGWRAGTFGRNAERVEHVGRELPPIAVMLLPGELERFVLREQAEDLLAGPGVVAVEPARMSYGAYLRLPESVADGLAATQARRLKLPGVPRVIVIFHPLQYPLARGLIARHPDAELWYWRYEAAFGGTPRKRERLADLHLAASLRAEVNIDVSEEAGSETMPELKRLIGEDDEAARLIQQADVGIVPFQCNDIELWFHILRHARRGRRTIAPARKGVRAWEHAVTFADGPQEWIEALRANVTPDPELREWAESLTAHELNRPLWERLEAHGIESGRLGSERISIVGTRPESRAGRTARSPGSGG